MRSLQRSSTAATRPSGLWWPNTTSGQPGARSIRKRGRRGGGWSEDGRRSPAAPSLPRAFPQLLRIDVDHERGEQDQPANEDLQEAVDLDVVEAVVEDAEDQQA